MVLTKEMLTELKGILEEELETLQERSNRLLKEMSESDLQSKFHGDEADLACYMDERNRMLRLRDRDRKMMNRIVRSLEMIKESTYGLCTVCGDDIPYERLKLRPIANLCMECKLEQEEREERTRNITNRWS